MYSRKLHIRVRLARTSCETSLTILALSLGDKVVNHLARRCTRRRVSFVAPDRARPRASWGLLGAGTDHFALPGEQDQIAVNISISPRHRRRMRGSWRT